MTPPIRAISRRSTGPGTGSQRLRKVAQGTTGSSAMEHRGRAIDCSYSISYCSIDLWGGVKFPTGGESPRLSELRTEHPELNRWNPGADGRVRMGKDQFPAQHLSLSA